MPVKAGYLALAGGGALLLWAGIKGKSWSGALRDVISGQNPANAPNAQSIFGTSATGTGSGGGSVPNTAPGPEKTVASRLLSSVGRTAQMPYLLMLWTRESGWNPRIANASSGAFGIAQALGHGGSGTAAANVHYTILGVGPAVGTINEYGAQYGLTIKQAQQANAGNPVQQIRWGIGYIDVRYGGPKAAWEHETAHGWY